MDWGRAKTILILTFLLLNLLLAYLLWNEKLFHVRLTFQDREHIWELQQLLNEKNIGLEQELPEMTPQVAEIDVRFVVRGEEQGVRPLETPVAVGEKEREELELQIPEFRQYRLDPGLSREGELVYSQLHEDLPLFDIHLKLYVTEGQYTHYSQSMVEVLPEEEKGSSRHPALAAHRAVRLLAERYLKSGDVIRDIRLGYHGPMYDSESQVLAPKWRFVLDDGDIYYIHAISGEVERPQRGS